MASFCLRRFLVPSMLAVLAASAAACSAEPSEDEGTSADEVKKKIGGASGESAVLVPAGTIGTGPFLNTLTMRVGNYDTPAVKLVPGQTVKTSPGTFTAFLGGQNPEFTKQGALVLRSRTIGLPPVTVAAGQPSSLTKLSCVSIEPSSPITFGTPSVTLRLTAGPSYVEQYDALLDVPKLVDKLNDASRVKLLVPAGPIELEVPGIIGTKKVTAPENGCAKLTLKTRTFAAEVDAVDPAFPDEGFGTQARDNVFMKVGDATLHPREFGSRTFLEGRRVSATAWGITQDVGPTATKPVRFNRLEVEDLVETMLDGTKVSRPGSFRLKKVGDYLDRMQNFSFPTHVGVDLLDGTYEVTITAQGANGPLSDKKTVSFP